MLDCVTKQVKETPYICVCVCVRTVFCACPQRILQGKGNYYTVVFYVLLGEEDDV
jgi:hypothetical protein